MMRSVLLCCLAATLCTGCTRMVIPIHQIPFFLIDNPTPPVIDKPIPHVETQIASEPKALVLLGKEGSKYQSL